MDVGGVYGGGAGAISHYSSHVALLHRRLFLLLKLGDIDFIFRNGGFFFHFCYLLFEIIAQILSHHLPRLLLRLLLLKMLIQVIYDCIGVVILFYVAND